MSLRPKELRKLSTEELNDKLKELKEELMHLRGEAAMGGAPLSPGKIRAVRTDIARLLTILREREINLPRK